MALPNRHFENKYRQPMDVQKLKPPNEAASVGDTGEKYMVLQIGWVLQYGELQPKEETKRSIKIKCLKIAFMTEILIYNKIL